MSDTINVLNQIIGLCGQRELNDKGKHDVHPLNLLEQIVVIAGDCLEEHKAASLRAKPRKQRVFRQAIGEVVAILSPPPDCPEAFAHAVEQIQEVLDNYEVKI